MLIVLFFFIMVMFLMFLSLLFFCFNFKFFFWFSFSLSSFWNLDYFIFFDKFSVLFIFFIVFVFLFILVFCIYYLGDLYFVLVIILFIMVMVNLIVSVGLLTIMMWWDLLGLISFVLVIYYNSLLVIKSSLIVLLFNRLGDLFVIFSLSIFMLSWMNNIFDLNYNLGFFFFLLGLLLKSSQFPFNLWLVKAMVAPLPISSLVHSSTLVTVGVYFMFRLVELLNLFLVVFFVVCSLLFFSLKMLWVNDFKKLMALSTMNNLSLMMYLLCLDLYLYSYLYMMVHALFKSMMFLCLGVMIYNNYDFQDVRMFGMMINYSPLIFYMVCFCVLVASGMSFMCLFYLKDLVFDIYFYVKMNFFFFFFFFFFSFLYLMKFLNMIVLSNNFMICSLFIEDNFFMVLVLIFKMMINIFLVKLYLMFYFYMMVYVYMGLKLKIFFFLYFFNVLLFLVELGYFFDNYLFYFIVKSNFYYDLLFCFLLNFVNFLFNLSLIFKLWMEIFNYYFFWGFMMEFFSLSLMKFSFLMMIFVVYCICFIYI